MKQAMRCAYREDGGAAAPLWIIYSASWSAACSEIEVQLKVCCRFLHGSRLGPVCRLVVRGVSIRLQGLA